VRPGVSPAKVGWRGHPHRTAITSPCAIITNGPRGVATPVPGAAVLRPTVQVSGQRPTTTRTTLEAPWRTM
jgi:hypothetical protein